MWRSFCLVADSGESSSPGDVQLFSKGNFPPEQSVYPSPYFVDVNWYLVVIKKVSNELYHYFVYKICL